MRWVLIMHGYLITIAYIVLRWIRIVQVHELDHAMGPGEDVYVEKNIFKYIFYSMMQLHKNRMQRASMTLHLGYNKRLQMC